MSNSKKWTLITGASKGIGKEFAQIAAEQGKNVILVARDLKLLNQLAQDIEKKYPAVSTKVISIDLAQSGAAQMLFNQTELEQLEVHELINNAGYGIHGAFLDFEPAWDLGMLQLNMITLTELSRFYGQKMKERRAGAILNVASTAAFQPGPIMSTYFATKAYVVSLSQAHHMELKPYGIHVTALCPGATASEFMFAAKIDSARLFTLGAVSTSQNVARAGYNGLLKNKRVVIPGFFNKLMVWSLPFIPAAWVLNAVNFIMGGVPKVKDELSPHQL